MTANSTEAETDKAIPLDKLSSRVGDQTGREGYVVFVLNIGRMLIISHTYIPTIVGAAAGCDLLFLKKQIKRSQPAAAPTWMASG
jgi:hypothetical protein